MSPKGLAVLFGIILLPFAFGWWMRVPHQNHHPLNGYYFNLQVESPDAGVKERVRNQIQADIQKSGGIIEPYLGVPVTVNVYWKGGVIGGEYQIYSSIGWIYIDEEDLGKKELATMSRYERIIATAAAKVHNSVVYLATKRKIPSTHAGY